MYQRTGNKNPQGQMDAGCHFSDIQKGFPLVIFFIPLFYTAQYCDMAMLTHYSIKFHHNNRCMSKALNLPCAIFMLTVNYFAVR